MLLGDAVVLAYNCVHYIFVVGTSVGRLSPQYVAPLEIDHLRLLCVIDPSGTLGYGHGMTSQRESALFF